MDESFHIQKLSAAPINTSGQLIQSGTTCGPTMTSDCVRRRTRCPRAKSAKTIAASPASLYLLTENADKVVAKAVKLGAAPKGPVMDMFWGDRCGTVVDPDGYAWMVATHIAEPKPQEMKKRMKEQMPSQPASTAGGS